MLGPSSQFDISRVFDMSDFEIPRFTCIDFFLHCGVCSLALLLIGVKEYNFLNFHSAFYKCFGSLSFSTLHSTKGYTRNLLNLDSLNSKAL